MKNRTHFKLFPGLLVSMAVIFCWLPVHVFSAEFSADIVITGTGDNYTFKLQVRDNMYRLQKIKGPMNVPPFPSIVNRDTGVTWGLNDQMRQYVEMRDIEKTIMMNPLAGWAMTRKGLTEKSGSTETVNGYECETRLYTEAGKSEPAAKVWTSKKLNHIIRDERFGMNKNPVLELQNIQEGLWMRPFFKFPQVTQRWTWAEGRGLNLPIPPRSRPPPLLERFPRRPHRSHNPSPPRTRRRATAGPHPLPGPMNKTRAGTLS